VSEDDDIALTEMPQPQAEVPARIVRHGAGAQAGSRVLAAEVPVSITYNGIAHAVMMATPADLEDFVTGFSLTEEIVSRADEISELDIRPVPHGLLARATIPAERARRLVENRRNLVGQTGCGLCGIIELEAAVRHYAPLETAPGIDAGAIRATLAALPSRQPLNAATGAAHAAAFALPDGRIIAVREDVGRHNALDKLVGHLARDGIQPGSGFAMVTSRISFELVQKCLAARIPALVGISAPTALAVDLAARHRLTLVALARADGFQVFSDPFDLLSG
jgi:FdhD protein